MGEIDGVGGVHCGLALPVLGLATADATAAIAECREKLKPKAAT